MMAKAAMLCSRRATTTDDALAIRLAAALLLGATAEIKRASRGADRGHRQRKGHPSQQ